MSYDLQVWSSIPVGSDSFGKPDVWRTAPRSWTHGENNWKIIVYASDRVQPEDVPDELSSILPGIEWLTHLHLEGRATDTEVDQARSIASDIARVSHGAVFDPQENSVQLPSGVKHFAATRSKETFDVVSMTWWFLEGPLTTREGREQFIVMLERMLPEALPKRYGLYEPPQHAYSETGRGHFLGFLEEHQHDFTVWYPSRPVVSVHLGLPHPLGAHRLGFRTNHLRIEVEKSSLPDRNWHDTLRAFWQELSALVNPIYGDVRMLDGYIWIGATVGKAWSSQRHQPIKSWFWAGIPPTIGSAVVLGEIYQSLWPNFVAHASISHGLAFASLPDWTLDGDLSAVVGSPPPDQTLIGRSLPSTPVSPEEMRRFFGKLHKREYPPGWPFGSPFPS